MIWINANRYAGSVAIAAFMVVCLPLVNDGKPSMLQFSATILIGLGIDGSVGAWRRGMRFWQAENAYYGLASGIWFWLWMCVSQGVDDAIVVVIQAVGAMFFAGLMAGMNRGVTTRTWGACWSSESHLSITHWLLRLMSVACVGLGVVLDRIPEGVWCAAFCGAVTAPMRDWVGRRERFGRIVYWATYAVAIALWIVHLSEVL